jgi:hypothetical protein
VAAFATVHLGGGLTFVVRRRVSWLGVPLDMALHAIFVSLNAPFLPMLANFPPLPLLSAIMAASLHRVPLLSAIRTHLTPLVTPFGLLVVTSFNCCVATPILPFGAVLTAFRGRGFATILMPINPLFSPVLTSLSAILAPLALPVSSVLPPILSTFRTDVAAMVTPITAPICAPVVPGTMAVISVPIGVECEADDRHVGSLSVDNQWTILVVPKGVEIVSRNPTAGVSPSYVAPRITAHTPVYCQPRMVRNHVHHGKAGRRPGAHVEIGCGPCIGGRCRTG